VRAAGLLFFGKKLAEGPGPALQSLFESLSIMNNVEFPLAGSRCSSFPPGLVFGVLLSFAGIAFNAGAQLAGGDYLEPRLLIGSIFSLGPEPRKLLFKSERRASSKDGTVEVTCDYTYPNGSLAARDRIIYKTGQLASFEEEELQTGENGSAVIRLDPKDAGKSRIFFEYTIGQGEAARRSSGIEELAPDTLIDDMIPDFIASHWGLLEKGSPARFRYIVLSRKETVGFKLVKEADTTWRGESVVRLRMQPTSFIIAQLVDPLFFVVEKHGPHRILEYTGRTTPLIKVGNKWKELDAVSVFDWQRQVVSANHPN